MNKVSSALLAAAAAGGAHVASNLVADSVDRLDTKGKTGVKRTGFKGTKAGTAIGNRVHSFKARSMQTGILHGLDPKRTHPSNVAMLAQTIPIVGSAHYALQYDLGHMLGAKYKHLTAEQKQQKLESLQRTIQAIPKFRNFPHVAAIHDGIDRVLTGQKSLGRANSLEQLHKNEQNVVVDAVHQYLQSNTPKARIRKAMEALDLGTHTGLSKALKARRHLQHAVARKVGTTTRISHKLKATAMGNVLDKHNAKPFNKATRIAVSPRLGDVNDFADVVKRLPRNARKSAVSKIQILLSEFA